MDIFYFIFIVSLGSFFINIFKKKLTRKQFKELKVLGLYHLLITVAFFLFTRNGGGDSWTYWTFAKQMTTGDFYNYLFDHKGTYFIFALNYIPANLMGMSFFANTLFYSLIGFMGLVYFYVATIQLIPYNSTYGRYQLFPLLFFLPNLHFWIAGISKDSILFFCIGMFVYGMFNISKRLLYLFFSLLLAFLVRPHIVLFLILGFGIAFFVSSKIKIYQRVLFSIILLLIGIAILPTVLSYVKIEEITVESVETFSNQKTTLLSRSDTGSRLSPSTPLPIRVFSFLFRPFFFDINGIPSVIASFENLILLLLTLSTLVNKPFKTLRSAPFIVKGLVIFLFLGTIAFSLILGNVGIMLRMRNMFLPGLLIFILWSFSYRQKLE